MSSPLQGSTLRLRNLMARHNLTRTGVAELLGCSTKTVSCWRCESPRAIPEREIERLELKLEVRRLNTRLSYLEARIAPPRAAAGVSHA